MTVRAAVCASGLGLALCLAAPARAEPAPVHAAPLASDDGPGAIYRQLQAQDARLATILYRLNRGATTWCTPQRDAGWLLGDVRQYPAARREMVRQALGLAADTMVFVAAVIPGGPADQAGIRPGAALLTVNGQPIDGADMPSATRAPLDAVEAAVASALAAGDGPLVFTTALPGEVPVERALLSAPDSCAIPGQISSNDDEWATSNGSKLAVPIRAARQMDDDALTAVVAHEMAHILLRHRAAALADEAAYPGGRNAATRNSRYRTRELEADARALELLDRAGADPAVLVAYLRAQERQQLLPGMAFPRHPSWAQRRRVAEALLARLRPAPAS